MSVSISAVLVKFMLSRFLAVENVIEVVAQGLGSSGLRAINNPFNDCMWLSENLWGTTLNTISDE